MDLPLRKSSKTKIKINGKNGDKHGDIHGKNMVKIDEQPQMVEESSRQHAPILKNKKYKTVILQAYTPRKSINTEKDHVKIMTGYGKE